VTDTLTALDATFLELEEHSEGALMHAGGVMVFDALPDGGAPTVEELCAVVTGRLGSLPRYWQRLSSERTGAWAWPHWTEDQRFDIRNHVSRAALPAPGGDTQLCDWIADFYSHKLDRTRPLWEMVLLEGLEEGRWALAQKTHQCLADGVGAVGIAGLLLDDRARPPGEDRLPMPGSAADPLWRSLVPSAPGPIGQAARAGGQALKSGLEAALRPRETLSRSRMLVELLFDDGIVGAPRCSLNVAIGPSRRYAAVRVPLVDLTAISSELGGSINDAILAACTSGLRSLLLERDEDPPAAGLRAMVPVNLSEAFQTLALDSRVSSLFVGLPVDEPLALVRLRRIVASTLALKSSGVGDAAKTIVDLAALAPPLVHAVIARLLYGTRLFNLTVTNVPGARAPRYAFGAPLREVYPIVSLAAGHAVGIATFSHDGLVTFGISADCESMPDLGVLTHGIEEGIDELLELAEASRLERDATDAPTIHLTHS
jgi:diacylglycerol O-acyltransferase / wax synthase